MSNPVTRWQIITKNPESHSAFYRDVFGWEISADNAMNYRQATTGRGDAPDGGFWPSPSDETPCCVQLFIEVQDVGSSITRATEHGAQVAMPAQQLPEGEVMALLVDSQGLGFGIFSPAKAS